MLIVGIDSKAIVPVLPLDSEFTGAPAMAVWVQMIPNVSAKSSLLIILLRLCNNQTFHTAILFLFGRSIQKRVSVCAGRH